MAVVVRDTFTISGGETAGEDLSAHTGELGATWTVDSAQATLGAFVLTSAGRARVGGSTAGSAWVSQYTASGTPSGADYICQADLILPTLPGTAYWAFVLGRTAPGSGTQYAFGYDSTLGAWRLAMQNASTWSTLAQSTATLVAGQTYTLALQMNGTTLSGLVNGTVVCGPLTNSAISAVGKAGLFVYVPTASAFTPTDSLGPQFDNVLVQEGVVVSVSPGAASLLPGAQQQFSATVSGSSNQSVSWSVLEGSSGGTISSGGLYTAPAGPGTYHVVATAAADGVSSAQAIVAVATPAPPGVPRITLLVASGQDTISVAAAVAPGSYPVAGYRLWEGPSSGTQTDTGLTISPSTFPASFPAQPTAAAGAGKYYVVTAYDNHTPPGVSGASGEVYSRTTGLVPSGVLQRRVFCAPYGAASSGLAATLGFQVYDDQGAPLGAHTVGQTFEIGAGSGIYAALVSIDRAYSGVLVWDAPSGGGPYAEAFDAGPLAEVSGYSAGLDPASQVLASPDHKLLTNAAGQVQLALGQSVPAANVAQTVGDALNAARAQGFGKWVLSGTSLVLYAADGTTMVRTFVLDDPLNPTTRS